ncbi:flagellar hook-associated protein FlgK [Neobacillus sp. D3-1R]|uniref:flagellar hook-associated protein FlgK n=1 Tax=Neobacillus sp. D3-1R TaxID=3445778 RepID=UPI003FA0FACA
MRSTFMGLETARRGMYTQQGALYTTGHNISNANTPGFTRQRVNFEQTEPYPAVGMNRPEMPGQMGTGVKAGSVQRVRESFLDVQYRGENNKLGYWESRAESYGKLEEIMNEPSESGLSKTMDMFWQSLQDLAVNPTNPGARSVVRQRGIAVAETFNYLHNSLSSVKSDLKNEIDVTNKEINSLTYQISKINEQIRDVEPHGYLPNDLYDERDRLVDQLSSLANIRVDYVSSGGNALAIAEGSAVIKMVNETGSELGILVSQVGYNEVKVNFDGADGSVKTISIGNTSRDFIDMKSSGKLKAVIESYGYDDKGKATGVYTDMLNELDNLAFTFANEFNNQHIKGISPNELDNKPPTDKSFFSDNAIGDRKGYAGRIKISKAIEDSLDNIATSKGPLSDATKGDATNALALANILNKDFDYKNGGTQELSNFKSHYESVIGGMAVLSQEAVRLTNNSTSLRQAVDEKRQATSSVSLDEEMTNMIQFQQAYNASARMISITDELLDKIINGMGTGGR